jgi:hypothetical protein
MKSKIIILDKTIELAAAYASSGAVKVPEDFANFLQLTYDKLIELNEGTETIVN